MNWISHIGKKLEPKVKQILKNNLVDMKKRDWKTLPTMQKNFLSY